MGARVYIPAFGRFLQVDPVEGGTDNSYVYANDPVNEFDLDGKWIQIPAAVAVWTARVAAAAYATYRVAKVVSRVVPAPIRKKAVAYTSKISTPIKSNTSKAITKLNNKYPWTNKNNILRINPSRIAVGPARNHYRPNGKLTQRNPYHVELNWKQRTFFVEKHLSKRKSVDVWRKRW